MVEIKLILQIMEIACVLIRLYIPWNNVNGLIENVFFFNILNSMFNNLAWMWDKCDQPTLANGRMARSGDSIKLIVLQVMYRKGK